MKFSVVGSRDLCNYETYEAAEEAAKRYVANSNGKFGQAYILKAVAEVKAPVPEAVVTKLT